MKAGPTGERCPDLADCPVALPVMFPDHALVVVAVGLAGW
jgi:hypothetical protein